MGTTLVAGSTAVDSTVEADRVVATAAVASQVDNRVLAARHRVAASVDRMAAVVDILSMVVLARAGRSAVAVAMAALLAVDT